MTVMERASVRTPESQASCSLIGAFDLAAVREQLRDGTMLRIRRLRPQDEPMLHDFAGHMSAEDLRLRFLASVKSFPAVVAARLSQLDYDRDLGLLAERDGTALAMAQLFTDPDKLRAEYAIAVRSDWKGRGLGYLLMTRLIDIARQGGLGELVGEVLRENVPMLQMGRKLGFTVAPEPGDPAIVLVKKRLKLAENPIDGELVSDCQHSPDADSQSRAGVDV